MFVTERDYRREHLRAPFKELALYAAGNHVFKARGLNLSEGGLLLENVPFFPEKGEEAPLLLSLPQYPLFKSFSLEKLKGFNRELFPRKCVRAVCEVVRKSELDSDVDQVFAAKIGARFVELSAKDRRLIKEYVESFAGNLVYLQVLIDNIHADSEGLEKVRALSSILNYDPEAKISQLRKDVARDYTSLQWL